MRLSVVLISTAFVAVVLGVLVESGTPGAMPSPSAAVPEQSQAVSVDAQTVTQATDEQPPEEISPLRIFMRRKLQSSNRILEGLLVDKLKIVTEGADELLEISAAEHWRASNDTMYLQHSEEFRSSVKGLRQKAELGSLDGAALAWVDVTMNCIHCHDWVRNVMIAKVKQTKPPVAVVPLPAALQPSTAGR